jgi:hypothetical protein
MNKMLMVSNAGPRSARIVKATSTLLIGLALGTAFWVATTPIAQAQDMSPTKMIESQLPQGKTTASASRQEYVGAICGAVKKSRSAAPQIVRAAADAHPNWKKDILRSAFSCLGTNDCRLLNAVLKAAIASDGSDASEMTDLAIELAPNCASAFPQAAADEGNFGNPPVNQNPPPGSVGGGGGQSNVVAVCFNGVTRFLSPEDAQNFLQNNPGATLGACVVTQFQNN